MPEASPSAAGAAPSRTGWRGAVGAMARGAFHALPAGLQARIRARRRLASVGVWRVGRHRRRIESAVAAAFRGGTRSFLFLPGHSWHQASFQRPQQLARALGEVGCAVVYAERIAEHPWSTVDERARNRAIGLVEVAPGVRVARLPDEHVASLVEAARPDFVVGHSALEQRAWLPPAARDRLVYDVIDHERILDPGGGPAWRAAHAEWTEHARLVLATADDLVAWLRPARPDVLLVRNGVRIEDWEAGGAAPVPAEVRAAREAPVLVHYHGILGDPWFDWPLFEGCCAARPAWRFVLVGWPRGESMESLRARAARLPNCLYLGPKPYGDLPALLAQADVGIVPFLVHEGTHAASAIKVFEYFAAGKPVVSTPLREISRYRSVATATGPAAFVEAIERAVARRDDPDVRRTLREEAEANTWRSRAEDVLAALRGARAGNAR